MSYSDPIYVDCCLCEEDATDDPDTVKIGEHVAHERCAEMNDVYDIVQCPYCGAREMADDATAWTDCGDGRACQACAKGLEPETAESIVGDAVPAGQRNPLIDMLDGILSEVRT